MGLCALVFACAALTSAQGVEAQDAALRARVERLLSAGVEPGGARAALAALGEAGERALIAVFERVEAPSYVRLRALDILQAFASEASARYFEALLRAARDPADLVAIRAASSARLAGEPLRLAGLGDLHPARSALVLRRALEGLSTHAPLLRPALALDDVSWCLNHRDAHVRRAAAGLLATLEGGDVERALYLGLARERSTMVRRTLERALTDRSARAASLRWADPKTGSPPR